MDTDELTRKFRNACQFLGELEEGKGFVRCKIDSADIDLTDHGLLIDMPERPETREERQRRRAAHVSRSSATPSLDLGFGEIEDIWFDEEVPQMVLKAKECDVRIARNELSVRCGKGLTGKGIPLR